MPEQQQLAPQDMRFQQPQRLSALNAMAARFQVEPAKLLDTLKQTVFKGASDAQMMALCVVANEWNLNPFTKELYAFPDAKSGGIIPVIGVDGWLHRINQHPQYDGMDQEFVTGADGKPFSCTVTIYRKDRSRPMKHVELFSECFRKTDPWINQPHRMLGHRAVIQCARKAFGFSGADPEDAARMQERQVNARVVEPARPALFAAPISPPAAAESAATLGGTTADDDVAGTEPPAAKRGWPKGRPRGPRQASEPQASEPQESEPPDTIPFNLEATEETAKEILERKIAEAKLNRSKLESWCESEFEKPYEFLDEQNCALALENFRLLREACE